MTQVSAVSKIEHTGYELVKRRKTNGKKASMKDYAKVDFEPWPKPEDGKFAPSDKTMVDYAVWARTANAVMCWTKEQLVEMFDKLAGDPAASKGVLTTTSSFAPKMLDDPAIRGAVPTRLHLIDGKELQTLLAELERGVKVF